jgi:hypothetical protein
MKYPVIWLVGVQPSTTLNILERWPKGTFGELAGLHELLGQQTFDFCLIWLFRTQQYEKSVTRRNTAFQR